MATLLIVCSLIEKLFESGEGRATEKGFDLAANNGLLRGAAALEH